MKGDEKADVHRGFISLPQHFVVLVVFLHTLIERLARQFCNHVHYKHMKVLHMIGVKNPFKSNMHASESVI